MKTLELNGTVEIDERGINNWEEDAYGGPNIDINIGGKNLIDSIYDLWGRDPYNNPPELINKPLETKP